MNEREVEALAKALCATDPTSDGDATWGLDLESHRNWRRGHARAFLASDWLRDHDAALVAQARSDALREAADMLVRRANGGTAYNAAARDIRAAMYPEEENS